MSDGIGQESKPEKREQIGNAELERRIQLMQNQLEAAQTKTDLIAAMEAEITRLRAELAKAHELASDLGEVIGIEIAAGDELQSAIDGLFEMQSQIQEWRQLAEAEGQEPVAEVTQSGFTTTLANMRLPVGTKLYTHPAPAKVPEVNFDDVPVSVKELTPEAAWICGYYAYREAMLEAQGGE